MSLELYERLKNSAVLVDRRMAWIRVSGPDRVSWLQGMVTNDVARLGAGQGCYAAYLNPQGKVVSLLAVLADPDAFWLLTDRDNAARTVRELEKLLIMEDASITDCSSQTRILSLVGGGASGVVKDLGVDVTKLDSDYAHLQVRGFRCIRAVAGYDLVAEAQEADRLEERLIQAGALEGDASLWDLIRIESGLPRYGVDVDETTTLPELGEEGIDYQKGCYIGQEVVAKIKYIGHVNRRFVGLKLDGTMIPGANATLRTGGRDAGRITSALRSPGLGAVIALAYLRRGSDQPGSKVEVATDRGVSTGVVTRLPFVAHVF